MFPFKYTFEIVIGELSSNSSTGQFKLLALLSQLHKLSKPQALVGSSLLYIWIMFYEGILDHS